jgi:hypothetical protein
MGAQALQRSMTKDESKKKAAMDLVSWLSPMCLNLFCHLPMERGAQVTTGMQDLQAANLSGMSCGHKGFDADDLADRGVEEGEDDDEEEEEEEERGVQIAQHQLGTHVPPSPSSRSGALAWAWFCCV